MNVNTRFCVPDTTRHFVVSQEVNGEYFQVRFTPATAKEAMRTVGRWASNPELPGFTWYIACCMSNRIQKLLREVECSGK